MNINFLKLILVICVFLSSFSFAKTQQEEYKNDVLYSEEYFNYLIECASMDRQAELDKQKEIQKAQKKEKKNQISADEIKIGKEEEQEVITEEYTPFKLYVSQDKEVPAYLESFKKEDTKTIIPVSESFSFIQNTTKTRNKYNSNDYRILAGSEFSPTKYLTFATGLETNFRGLDQNPTSRKLYFTPSVAISDRVTLSFINKYNPQNGSTDYDVSFRVSPFKSKVLDFGVYSGVTHSMNGKTSESVSFSTNIYFK